MSEDRLAGVEKMVGAHDRVLDGHDRRIGLVEDSTAEAHRRLTALETGMERVHGDLKLNNALTANIDKSVTRIEENTRAGMEKLEHRTEEAIREIKGVMKPAVDAATAGRVMTSSGVSNVVGWIVAIVSWLVGLVVWAKGGR